MSTYARTVVPEPQSSARLHLPRATAPVSVLPDRQAPPRLPAWARVILTIVAMFSTFLLAQPAAMLLGLAKASQNPDPRVALAAGVVIFGIVLLCFVMVTLLLTRFVDRRPASVLGLRVNLRSMAALLGATALAAAVVVMVRFVVQLCGAGKPLTEGTANIPLWMVIALGLSQAFMLQGIGEELLWRGYLMQSLSARPALAVWVSAAAFASIHLISKGGQQNALDHILYLVTPFGFALLAGYLAMLTRSVWPAVGIHGGFHTGNLVANLLGVDSVSVAQGMAIGLVMMVLALVVAKMITPQRWEEIARRGPFALKETPRHR